MFFNFLYKDFSTYIKMSKIKSVKYYQDNKGKLQRSACERCQGPSKEEKKQ